MWNIPLPLHDEFKRDWRALTEENHHARGLVHAVLLETEEQLLSITIWESAEFFSSWRETLREHPLRRKWRAYQTDPPQRIVDVLHIDTP